MQGYQKEYTHWISNLSQMKKFASQMKKFHSQGPARAFSQILLMKINLRENW